VAGLVLCALAGLVFVGLRDGGTEITPPENATPRDTGGVATREDSASALLHELAAHLVDGSRRDVLRLAAPGSKEATRYAGTLYDNVRALGITELSLRYVDEDAGRLSSAESAELGGKGWVADVELSWRIGGYDEANSQMDVSFTFVQTPRGAALVMAGDNHDNAAPLWLLTDLAVERSRRALVMVADRGDVGQYARLADRAAADVRRVLPGWRGRLVVEVPESQAQLDRVLGTRAKTYDAIAAVTSTVDGSRDASAPTHVFVNPRVFGTLGKAGSQIVISHEAAHVATHAATSDMEMWLLEGFADYVALAHVDLPVSVTASQILAQVRQDGPPRQLPRPDEFDPKDDALGASYESAWLACRFLAERYGERRLVELYQAVGGGLPPEKAFRQVLGTSEKQFTRGWRDYLRRLAG
jgi:hypothetical protein